MNKTLFIYMRMNGGEFGLMFKRKKGGKKERKIRTEKKEEEEILNCASCGSHGRSVTQL